MANNQNLIPQNKRTKKEQRRIATLGGIKSGEARKRKKTLKEIADLILSKNINPKVKKILSKFFPDEDLKDITNDMAMVMRQAEKAILKADTKAYETLQATLGEKPIDRQEIDQKNTNIIIEDKEIIDDVIKKIKNM